MGILLGLLTALSWGSSDFLARFASRRIGSLRTTLYMQLIGLVLLTIFLPWIGGWGHLFDGSGWQPWAWGALAGALNAISTLSLYRSFEVGKLAVVAPLSASYPALTVAISAFTGEHLTAARAAGIMSDPGRRHRRGTRRSASRRSPPLGSNDRPTAHPTEETASGIGCRDDLSSRIRRALLAARQSRRAACRVRLHGLDDSPDVVTRSPALVAPGHEAADFVAAQNSVSIWLLGMGVLDTGAFVLNNLRHATRASRRS